MQNEPDLIIDEYGNKRWFLNDTGYNFEEWLKLTPLSSQEKLKLRLKYGQ